MSQQELERDDQEVMEIVNGHAHPEAVATAEEIAAAVTMPVADVPEPNKQNQEKRTAAEKLYQKHKRQDFLSVVLCVVACLCIATALLVAYYVPKLLIWVVNAGVLFCGIAIALKVDKYIQWWR